MRIAMAIQAGCVGHLVSRIPAIWPMALRTIQIEMLSRERICGAEVFQTGEARRREACLVVAGCAITAGKLSGMRIVFMATDALRVGNRLAEISRPVTAEAVDVVVLAAQRELRRAMVEPGR
jgi:hypothetical protein